MENVKTGTIHTFPGVSEMFSKQHKQTRKAFHRGFKLEIISKDERINIKFYFKMNKMTFYVVVL